MTKQEFLSEVQALGATAQEGRSFEPGRKPGALVTLSREDWEYQAQAPTTREARVMALMLLRKDPEAA